MGKFGGASLWVKWINVIRLKGQSISQVKADVSTSCGWKQILSLKDKIRDHVFKKLANGRSTFFWFDKWYDKGPLKGQSISQVKADVSIQVSQPLIQIKMEIGFRLFYHIFRFRCANQIQIQSLLINKQHLGLQIYYCLHALSTGCGPNVCAIHTSYTAAPYFLCRLLLLTPCVDCYSLPPVQIKLLLTSCADCCSLPHDQIAAPYLLCRHYSLVIASRSEELTVIVSRKVSGGDHTSLCPPSLVSTYCWRDADLSKDKSAVSKDNQTKLGDEGLCSGGTKLNSILITAENSASQSTQKKRTEGGMVDSQPMEEEFQGVAIRDAGTETHGGPTEPHDQQAKMKATPRKLAYADSDKEAPVGSLAKGFSDRFSLESSCTSDTHRQTRSTIKSTTKEKARIERSKLKRKRFGHQETSSDSEYEEGSDDAFEGMNSPYKRPKSTSFTQRITRFKYHKRAKLPWNIRVYEGNKDPEDHLVRSSWKNFRNKKRYTKDPTEIHGVKRRQNEGLQAFMDRFKSESSHIKGVPPVLCISAFMYGHSHLELAKKLNDKIPKTMDEMFERVKAFIRGEVAAGSAEMVRPSQGDKGYVRSAWTEGPERARNRGGPREARRNMGVYTPYPRKDTFTPLTKTPKEILAMESVSFPEPQPFIRTPEKQNLNKLCDYHGDKGHNTNDYYQLKKQIEEVVASEKLAHLVKDIRRNN
ncbi:hypothetical protein Tco_0885039 [Tanacetum coccineum]